MAVKRPKISGKKIAALRDRLSLTQEELAPKIGLTSAGVRRIEQREAANVYPKTLRNLATLMGVTPTEAALQLSPEDSKPAEGGISPEMLERITAAAAERGLTPDQFVTESLFGKPRKKK